MSYNEKIIIDDFNDYNYENVVFDIFSIDKKVLKFQLRNDGISHIDRLINDTNFIAIWNGDVHCFKHLKDIELDSMSESFELVKLYYDDGGFIGIYAYTVTKSNETYKIYFNGRRNCKDFIRNHGSLTV